MQAFFDHSEEVANELRIFWFRPEKPLNYTAGQFVDWHVLPPDASKHEQRRWFSLSSSPTEPLIALATRLGERRSAFKQHLVRLQPGDPVTVSDPMGDFVLPKDPAIPLVFVAGGIGITPVRSIIKWLIDTKEMRSVTLLYAVHSSEEFAFLDILGSYKDLRLVQLVTDTMASWPGEKGALTGRRILDLAPPDNSLIYISGPEPMTEALVKQLRELGINEERLVTDYFLGYSAF